ncbi:hypothetical protein TEA_019461 [Camellia sinensis var. sinensis]|uniref:Uncharacterized protein n=1 Tax=Camellia sinensis var. sinensis TaxID=542762 RepID=A0A4V3WPX3_CAMSN|nr:hypothetical protein TEA_019461 [Camellia sinensis var. sinensis]
MASCPSRSKTHYHACSVSFSCISSYSLIREFNKQLCRIRAPDHEVTSSSLPSINNRLSSLEDLHECVSDLLLLPHIEQALAREHNEKFVDKMVDGYLRLLDMCSTAKDKPFGLKPGLTLTLISVFLSAASLSLSDPPPPPSSSHHHRHYRVSHPLLFSTSPTTTVVQLAPRLSSTALLDVADHHRRPARTTTTASLIHSLFSRLCAAQIVKKLLGEAVLGWTELFDQGMVEAVKLSDRCPERRGQPRNKSTDLDKNCETQATASMLKEVEIATLAEFESLLSCVGGTNVQPRQSNWSLVYSKHKTVTNANEFEKVEAKLHSLSGYKTTIKSNYAMHIENVQNQLIKMESSIHT